MKKRLLFGALLMGSFLTANAQEDCAGAVDVSAGGTFVAADIDGEYPEGEAAEICAFTQGDPTDAGQAENLAIWYSFTATENGLLTVSTAVDGNDVGVDTRMRVLSGSCGTFTCVAIAEDIVYPGDLRSTAQNMIIMEGDTYYIVFDNMWAGNDEEPNEGGLGGFDFEVTFTATNCFPTTGGFMYVGEPTTSEVTIEWNEVEGAEGYNVIYGEAGFNPATEGEEINGLTTAEATFGDLEAATAYEFYVSTICAGDETSIMVGPIGFETALDAAMTPYETGFEDNGEDLVGWTLLTTTGGAWDISPAIPDFVDPYEGATFAIVGGFTAESDSWLFSRGIQLEGGTTYNISYYLAKVIGAGEGNVDNLEVSIGTEATIAGQTETLATFEPYEEDEYTQQGHNFTPETDGVYYVGFHYTGPAHAQENFGFLAMDNFAVTEGASTNDVLASKFTVYPNPATNMINIANAENILVNGVVITDLNGRTVKNVSYDGVAEAQINVSDLAAGMYMMTVSSDKGTMTKKIVKN